MKLFLLRLMIVFLVFTFSSQVYAQKKKKGKKRTQEIDFEADTIRGDLQKPELLYLLQKKQINFGRLIKFRDNFIPEMKKTAIEVERGVDP